MDFFRIVAAILLLLVGVLVGIIWRGPPRRRRRKKRNYAEFENRITGYKEPVRIDNELWLDYYNDIKDHQQ